MPQKIEAKVTATEPAGYVCEARVVLDNETVKFFTCFGANTYVVFHTLSQLIELEETKAFEEEDDWEDEREDGESEP